MKLKIKNEVYDFEATFGFYREMNATVKTHVDSMNKDENIGASYMLTKLINRDIETLTDILLLLNKNQKPSLKRADLEEYVATEADIDELFNGVIDFLFQSNMTKNVMGQVKKENERQKKLAEKMIM